MENLRVLIVTCQLCNDDLISSRVCIYRPGSSILNVHPSIQDLQCEKSKSETAIYMYNIMYITRHRVVVVAGVVTVFPVESALINHSDILIIKHLEAQ